MMMAQVLTITSVARWTGLRPSAIRYYESLGLLPAPTRVGGRRRYDAEVLSRLALITSARCMGFGLAQIGELLHGFAPDIPAAERWHVLAARQLRAVESQLVRVESMKQQLEAVLRCECLTLDACARAFHARTCPDEPAAH